MRYRVRGHSMFPLLKDGETVLVAKPVKNIKTGDMIVFNHPFREMDCIKQVKKVNPDGSVSVEGANIESEDAIGSIKRQDVIGKFSSTTPPRHDVGAPLLV